jgi:hypothetical protein
MPAFETAGRSLKVEPIIAPVHSDAEIETAITALGREPGGGLVVRPDAFMVAHRAPIISAAARNNVSAGAVRFIPETLGKSSNYVLSSTRWRAQMSSG